VHIVGLHTAFGFGCGGMDCKAHTFPAFPQAEDCYGMFGLMQGHKYPRVSTNIGARSAIVLLSYEDRTVFYH